MTLNEVSNFYGLFRLRNNETANDLKTSRVYVQYPMTIKIGISIFWFVSYMRPNVKVVKNVRSLDKWLKKDEKQFFVSNLS